MGIQAEDHGGDYLQRVAGGQILGLEAFNRQSSPEQLAGTGHMWQCLTHAAGREEGHQVGPQESPTVTLGWKGEGLGAPLLESLHGWVKTQCLKERSFSIAKCG